MSDPIAHTTATYDRIAPFYADRFKTPDPGFLAFRDRFAEALPAGARVADLGCGPGHDSAWFAERGMAPVGVDRSAGMLAFAAARGVPAVMGDLRWPPLAPASMEAVWSCAALVHVPADETAPTLRAWRAVLRPGGVLGLTTALGEGEGWEPVPYKTEFDRWFVLRAADALLAALDEAGFEVRHHETRVSHRRWFSVLASARNSPLP
jgi:SAM-dependent methyltransferase